MQIIIGNKAYSSWSMRGWLAVRHCGLPHTETLIPMWTEEWDRAQATPAFMASGGKVPILVDGDSIVWDSLAIVDYLADMDRDRFWPADPAARALARSMAAEMHSSYPDLRRHCTMNVRRHYPAAPLPAAVQADVDRIVDLWIRARTRFGGAGDYLFGDYGAADILFAPVATRFRTYAIPLPPMADAYVAALLAHPDVAAWIAAAQDEPWVVAKYELPAA